MRYLIALTLCSALCGQVATDANKHYQTPEGRAALARGLGSDSRDQTQRPQDVVDHMGIKPGMVVADVGTGVGYMLPYLSAAVGPEGKVIAEDIFDDFLAHARERVHEAKNVSFVKGREDDPLLAAGSCDRILVLDVYHHFDYPEKMLAAFHRALRPDGKLVIVEYYRRVMSNAPAHIRLDAPEVIREITAHGFRLLLRREQIQNVQYMLILEKN